MSRGSRIRDLSFRCSFLRHRHRNFILWFLLSFLALGGCGEDPGLSTSNQMSLSFEGCLRQVNEDGFGDSMNRYAWSMAVFNEELYVGTLNADYLRMLYGEFRSEGTEVWRFDGWEWEQVVDNGYGNITNTSTRNLRVYQGMLYAGTSNINEGCQAWRTADGTTWEQIMEGGFGAVENQSMRSMVEYNGLLYVGLKNKTCGGEIHAWDGNSWTQIVDGGITGPANTTIADLVPWRGLLYVFTWNVDGFEIYTYDGSSFDCIVGDGAPNPGGLDKPTNDGAMGVYVYNDRLYVGTADYYQGADLYRTDDGLNWVKLAHNGLNDPMQMYFWRMMEYRGDLYVGTFRKDHWLKTILDEPHLRGARLYRIDPDENIVELVGTNGLVMGGGFEDPQNYGIRTMNVFQDKLYIGTAQTFIWGARDGAEVWVLDPDAAGCDLQTSLP